METIIATLVALSLYEIALERSLRRKLVLRQIAYNATCARSNLIETMVMMSEDPATTKKDWQKLLPICRKTDRMFFESHPALTPKNCLPLAIIVSKCLA